MAFDPRQPIRDPKVFSPRGMWVDNREGSKALDGDDDDDDKTFVLDSKDMSALNRFLTTGRQLQTTRTEYLRWLGIDDRPGEISADLGRELEKLMARYVLLKGDCVTFRDVTWERILDIAGDIKSYAAISGGKVSTSYYCLMLKYIGDYYDESQKDTPDEKKLKQYKDAILYTVDAEIKKLSDLQDGAREALAGLTDFKEKCLTHKTEVEKNETNLSVQLKREGNDIDNLKKKIDDAKIDIADYQNEVDRQNKKIRDAPKYMWVWPIGTAVGTGIIVEAKKAIKRAKEAMEKVQKLLDEYEEKMLVATRLQTNLSFIADQVGGLSDEIQPAINTLGKLQGAWKNMETDLGTIKDMIEFDADNIPPMLIALPGLEGIVDEWNELKDYATKYIESAYLSEEVPKTDVKGYIRDLSEALVRIEAMEQEAANQ